MEALAASRAPFLLGVRHHSPALAAVVPALLDAADPEVVCVELPADFQPWLPHLADPETVAPVALAGLGREGRLAFYPFADFSPELAAVRWARERGVRVLCCDLPLGDRGWSSPSPAEPAPTGTDGPPAAGAAGRGADGPATASAGYASDDAEAAPAPAGPAGADADGSVPAPARPGTHGGSGSRAADCDSESAAPAPAVAEADRLAGPGSGAAVHGGAARRSYADALAASVPGARATTCGTARSRSSPRAAPRRPCAAPPSVSAGPCV
ncbi:hypothetical protein VR44_39020, partial [Streptomyces katrae]